MHACTDTCTYESMYVTYVHMYVSLLTKFKVSFSDTNDKEIKIKTVQDRYKHDYSIATVLIITKTKIKTIKKETIEIIKTIETHVVISFTYFLSLLFGSSIVLHLCLYHQLYTVPL